MFLEKGIKYIGLSFILISILLNPLFIKEFVSDDHQLETTTFFVIIIFEIILFLLGLFSFFMHKTIITKRKEIILAFLASIFVFLFLILLFEIASRYLHLDLKREEAVLGGNHPRNLIIPDKDVGDTLNPGFNSTEVSIFGEFTVDVNITSQGYRDFERNLTNCTTIFLGFGDSYTFGEGVMLNETYLALLERALNEKSTYPNNFSVCIIKAGVPGYGLHQMAGLYEKIEETYKPKMIFVGYFTSSLKRITNGYVERNGWPVAEAWLPVLQPCPNDYIFIKKKYFNDLHYSLYCHSYTYRLLASNRATRRIFTILFPDQVPPPFSAGRKTPEEYFLDMKDRASQKNTTLIVFPFCQENVSLADFFQNNSITYHPITCKDDWFFPHDKHWNSLGHKNVADDIYKYLEENNFSVY